MILLYRQPLALWLPSQVELSLVHDLRPHLMNGLQHALSEGTQEATGQRVRLRARNTLPPRIVNWHQGCDFVHSQEFQPYQVFVGLATWDLSCWSTVSGFHKTSHPCSHQGMHVFCCDSPKRTSIVSSLEARITLWSLMLGLSTASFVHCHRNQALDIKASH